MNVLDLLILILLLLATLLGWKFRALNLLGLAVSLAAGIWTANHFQGQLADLYRHFSPLLGGTLAWLTVFSAVAIILAVFFSLLARSIDHIQMAWLDRVLGALLALVVMSGLLLVGVTMLDNYARPLGSKVVENSRLAPPLLKIGRPFIPRLEKSLKPQ
ncbi:MAG: CvpA family protein [candidate division FCPU426 bacterium]